MLYTSLCAISERVKVYLPLRRNKFTLKGNRFFPSKEQVSEPAVCQLILPEIYYNYSITVKNPAHPTPKISSLYI